MKQVLPVVDTQLADMKLPGTCDRFLSNEFDHIDFQSLAKVPVQEQELKMNGEFKVQDEYDDTNRFFI